MSFFSTSANVGIAGIAPFFSTQRLATAFPNRTYSFSSSMSNISGLLPALLTEFYKEEELEQQEMMYYEGISDAKQEDLTYIRKKYEKIKENLEQIDGQINEAAKGWSRMLFRNVLIPPLLLLVSESLL